MTTEALLDREVSGMDVKEAAKKAAAYTADMETVMNPEGLSRFLSESGFAIESTHFDDARDCWEIGVGFVRDFDRSGLDAIPSLSSVWERTPLQGARTYKKVTISDASGEVVSYE